MSKPVVPVFFTIDESYAPWLSTALESMKANADHDHLIRAHIVYQDLYSKTIERLESLQDENFEVICSPMPHKLNEIRNTNGNLLRADYFTLTIFFRIFLPDLFEQYDKAIYLDSDIIVPGNICELYDTDLGGNLLGVVNDYSIAGVKPLVDYLENAIGIDHTRYFNSGILLMNFKKLREKHLGSSFLGILDRQQFDTIAPDQDYLNAMCKDQVLYLDPQWDSMPCELDEFDDPKIIHYNLFDKPWCYDNVKYERYFWETAEKSPWKDEIRKFKDSYSEEQKESDQRAKHMLVENAIRIRHSDHTMKSVFESAQEKRL